MQGHYNIKLMNSRGLSDEDFNRAQKSGTIDELLDSLDVVKEFDQKNQLTHYMAGTLFNQIFGAPSVASRIQTGNFFHYIGFGNDTGEYDYSYNDYNNYMLSLFVSPNGNAVDVDVKRTSAAIRTHQVIVEPNSSGLRAAYDVHRFLWTPSQVISSEIREVKFASTQDQSDGWYYSDECRTISRIRIKDANGNPQTIAKTADEVILVQWTFIIKSL